MVILLVWIHDAETCSMNFLNFQTSTYKNANQCAQSKGTLKYIVFQSRYGLRITATPKNAIRKKLDSFMVHHCVKQVLKII
jgi:hypothetical protein